MIVAMALDNSGEDEGGILVIGLEAQDVAMVLADDGAFHIPLGEAGAPVLQDWAIQILGPVSTARFQAEQQGGGGNGDFPG